jgi:hypothetical protein
VSFIVRVRVVVGGAHDARVFVGVDGPEVMRSAGLRRAEEAKRRTEA